MTSVWMQYNAELGGFDFIREFNQDEIDQEIVHNAEIMFYAYEWEQTAPSAVRERNLRYALSK